MAARRSLTPFVATIAATALCVGGVLVGTAPVSAAPALSEECTTALDALEEEFGDVDLDFEEELSDEVQAQLDALFLAYEEAVVPLYEQLGLDFFEIEDSEVVYELVDAAADDFETAAAARDAAELLLVDADEALTLAEEALVEATAGGDPDEVAAAQEARDLAATAQEEAAEVFAQADAAADAAEAVLTEVSAVVEAIELLDAELWEAFDEIFPDLPEIDVERLLELLTEVALECNDGSDDNGSDDDDDSTGGGTAPGTAPVAKPVSARASFTG